MLTIVIQRPAVREGGLGKGFLPKPSSGFRTKNDLVDVPPFLIFHQFIGPLQDLSQRFVVSSKLLYRVVCANECRNMHHKLAMNALQHLRGDHAEKWRDLFIRYYELYLLGSKDPDTKFKDFRNHVLHVSDNFWGGAITQAEKWYAETVKDIKAGQWKQAVYSAGVLSHYFMDPLMPLHTGQTEEEGVIHRACEWSINKSYDQLVELLVQGDGYPEFELPKSGDWLKRTVSAGASLAHQHYQTYIDHYNIEVGVKDPPAGLDDELKQITAKLIGYASVGFARVLERAFGEAESEPVAAKTTLLGYLTALTIPFTWVLKKISSAKDKSAVSKVYNEFKKTGKVIKALSTDEKTVRKLHAEEVLKVDLAELDKREIGPVGSKSTAKLPARKRRARPKRKKKSDRRSAAESTDSRTTDTSGKTVSIKFHLEPNEPLEQAPSIGPKTARRFADLGIDTVGDLIVADPRSTAVAMNNRHIDEEKIEEWQTQAKLACRIPGIRGHDAQILVACGFDDPNEITEAEPEQLLSLVEEFIDSPEGKSVLRGGKKPDLSEVKDWIVWSKKARPLQAA